MPEPERCPTSLFALRHVCEVMVEWVIASKMANILQHLPCLEDHGKTQLTW